MNNYIKRLLENDILENSKSFPVILVCGPRQVGKTTILNKLSNNKINYITLDDPLIRKLAKEDPALFLENNKPPLIIDEIQYATELLPYIKIQVDKARLNALQNNSDSNGLYYLTGSQMFTLMQNVSESLAGRVGIIDMYGLSYSELIGKEQNFFLPTKNRCEQRENNPRPETLEVFERIIRGSFPALYQNKNISTEKFYSGYLRTYLERDIRDLIITINNTVYPIGIKKSKNPDRNMIKNFKILNKGEKEIGEGGVICMVDKILPLDSNNIAIPIQCI